MLLFILFLSPSPSISLQPWQLFVLSKPGPNWPHSSLHPFPLRGAYHMCFIFPFFALWISFAARQTKHKLSFATAQIEISSLSVTPSVHLSLRPAGSSSVQAAVPAPARPLSVPASVALSSSFSDFRRAHAYLQQTALQAAPFAPRPRASIPPFPLPLCSRVRHRLCPASRDLTAHSSRLPPSLPRCMCINFSAFYPLHSARPALPPPPPLFSLFSFFPCLPPVDFLLLRENASSSIILFILLSFYFCLFHL